MSLLIYSTVMIPDPQPLQIMPGYKGGSELHVTMARGWLKIASSIGC